MLFQRPYIETIGSLHKIMVLVVKGTACSRPPRLLIYISFTLLAVLNVITGAVVSVSSEILVGAWNGRLPKATGDCSAPKIERFP